VTVTTASDNSTVSRSMLSARRRIYALFWKSKVERKNRSHSSRKSLISCNDGNFCFRALPIRKAEKGGAVTRTVSMPYFLTIWLARRSAKGNHTTSGSGQSTRRIKFDTCELWLFLG